MDHPFEYFYGHASCCHLFFFTGFHSASQFFPCYYGVTHYIPFIDLVQTKLRAYKHRKWRLSCLDHRPSSPSLNSLVNYSLTMSRARRLYPDTNKRVISCQMLVLFRQTKLYNNPNFNSVEVQCLNIKLPLF